MPAYAFVCAGQHETVEMFASWRDRTQTTICHVCGATADYSFSRSLFSHPPEFFPYVSTAHGEYVTSRQHLKRLDRKAGLVPLEGQMHSERLRELQDKGKHAHRRAAR